MATADSTRFVCARCGKRFIRKNHGPNPKYCSLECTRDRRAERAEVSCRHCGVIFELPAALARTRKYCSGHCAGLAKTAGLRAPTACVVCGGQFTVQKHRVGKAVCCSADCRRAWARRPIPRTSKRFGKTCPTCGKKFTVPTCNRDKRYCSKSCADRRPTTKLKRTCSACGKTFLVHRSEVVKAKGRGRYCSRRCYFDSVKSLARRIAARGKCERCGWKDEPAVLQWHHKDGDNRNDAEENISLLCPTCHMLVHFREKTGPFRELKTAKRGPKTYHRPVFAGS